MLNLDILSRPETERALQQEYQLPGPALLQGLPPQPGCNPPRPGQVRVGGLGITWCNHLLRS